MTSLFGIQVRSVGRQLLHHDLGVLSSIAFHRGGAMGLQAIPDHHQRAGVVSLKMPQEDNDVGSVDRMIEVPLVDPPRQCQGDRRRYLTTLTDPSQDGSPPRGGPCAPRPAWNEKPVSSMTTMAACFRRAFFADPRPILLKPGPDHFLISLFGVNGRDLWAPTRSPEPSGQVIRMVRDTELAPDQITDPSQGPAIGLESGLEGALAEGLQDAVPLRGGQPGRSPRPVPAAKGSQPRGRMIAQLFGPLPNGPEADTQPSGDLGMSQATGSEQPSTLQPTFFNSHFSIAPDKNLPFFSKPDERWGCADIPVKLGDIARTK